MNPIKDYVEAAKNSADDSVKQNAERLHRIAQVTARVVAQIESNVSQTDLDEAGLTKAEFLALVSRQVELLVSVIVNDIEETLADPNFDPDSILEGPEYAVEPPINNEPPTTEPNPGTGSDLLSERIAQAQDANPFYRQTPSGAQEVVGSNATYLEFAESDTLPDRYYFMGLKRQLETSGTTGTPVLYQAQAASNGEAGSVAGEQIEPDLNRVLVFQEGRQNLIQVNDSYMSEITVSAETNGTIAGITGRNTPEVAILSKYAMVDLSGLSTADTIASLYPSISPASFTSEANNSIFPDGSAAYALNETLVEPLYVTSWHGLEESNFGSDSHCSYHANITVVQSCNVVYGSNMISGSAAPATTFDSLTYPTEASMNGGEISITGGIGFEHNGQQYHLYLFGDKADGSGRIEVSTPDTLVYGVGTWTVVEEPFEHIRLDLPDGVYYNAFLDEVGGEGYAFLFEHEGFVRAGRATPHSVEVPTYFKRNAETLHLNETALNHVLNRMNDWGMLTAHPGWTDPDY
ncbi:hypothetical protein Q667_17585 [Marinobacter sp. C1S70]|uniref:hypothetical protein n=1 Tax=Marinobacter sp. C1S70 TaxID=1396859 RepID=UPI0003B7EC70|nr:hypothetical protein [Marinobacter sp. C1S70]ERS85196.1 hypothetical protein Q667_17585 [Marinobacter sp. C1S70]